MNELEQKSLSAWLSDNKSGWTIYYHTVPGGGYSYSNKNFSIRVYGNSAIVGYKKDGGWVRLSKHTDTSAIFGNCEALQTPAVKPLTVLGNFETDGIESVTGSTILKADS